jgi:diguanylate cyclase (GGDEF)-like protein
LGRTNDTTPYAVTSIDAVTEDSATALAEDIKQRLSDGGVAKDGAHDLFRRALDFAVEAEQVIACQRSRIDHLQSLAETDELTGILNRRGFERAMRANLARARRHGERGVLIFIDLDGFKGINDTHGHPVGDEVLIKVAGFLTGNIRSGDHAGRLGGDEFALMLAPSALEATSKRALFLERGLNRLTVRRGDEAIPIRASFGIVPFSGRSRPDDLLRRADESMYAKKNRKISRLARSTRVVSLNRAHLA